MRHGSPGVNGPAATAGAAGADRPRRRIGRPAELRHERLVDVDRRLARLRVDLNALHQGGAARGIEGRPEGDGEQPLEQPRVGGLRVDDEPVLARAPSGRVISAASWSGSVTCVHWPDAGSRAKTWRTPRAVSRAALTSGSTAA